MKSEKALRLETGPVDAVYKAISEVTKNTAKLVRYEIRAVTSGTAAMGEVTVQLEQDGPEDVGRRRFHGRDRGQRQSLRGRAQPARRAELRATQE